MVNGAFRRCGNFWKRSFHSTVRSRPMRSSTTSVSDDGAGRASQDGQPASTPGLGTSIVEALARQLDARVEISSSPQGTKVSVVHGVT